MRMLLVDYRSAFNTTVPEDDLKITRKLRLLGLYAAVWDWIVSFMTDRPMSHDRAAKHSSFRKCKGRRHSLLFGVKGGGGCLLRLLGVHIIEDLCWTTRTPAAVKSTEDWGELDREPLYSAPSKAESLAGSVAVWCAGFSLPAIFYTLPQKSP